MTNAGWRIAAALAAIFIAGVTTGLFVGAFHAHHEMFGPPRHDLRDRMRHHLAHELRLTPEQLDKIGPQIDRTADELEAIRRETGERVVATLQHSHQQISQYLTPEQQARLHDMEERHRRSMHDHPGPPPP